MLFIFLYFVKITSLNNLLKNNIIHLVLFENTEVTTKILSSQSLSANLKRFEEIMKLDTI